MVARIATGDIEEEYVKVPESVPNRSEGGKKGGKARSETLSPERRSEIASQGAAARWDNQENEATVA